MKFDLAKKTYEKCFSRLAFTEIAFSDSSQKLNFLDEESYSK